MIDQSKPVRVFRNLTHGCYSILQDGKLQASARQVLLSDVEFKVRESGRQRMIRERRRNVHAFAVGRLVDYVHPSDSRQLAGLEGRVVSYDPHELGAFYDVLTAAPLAGAGLLHLDEQGAIYA